MRIIPRSEWGAKYSDGAPNVTLKLPYAETWLHHSVTRQLAPDATVAQECAAMREIEQIGQDRFRQGISYTWLIFPSGRIYEGHSVNRRGAHTGGRNDIARAICFAGNYQTHELTTAQVTSAAWLLRHAHEQGWAKNPTANGGHRDLKATDCPGRHTYDAIPDINYLASQAGTEELMALTEADIALFWYGPRFRGNENYAQVLHLAAADAARTLQIRQVQDAQGVAIAQILAAVTGGSTADAEQTWAEVRDAAFAGGEQGARDAIAEVVVPVLRGVLAEVLGEDNSDQATAVVDLVAARLGKVA